MKNFVTPLVLLLSVCSPIAAQQVPKLVVLLTVEDLRTDIYEMMEPHLSEGGIARLVREGRVYETVISPLEEADVTASEAILHTGTLPLTSGITSRQPWKRREGGKRTQMSSVLEDKNYIGFGTSERLSPLALTAPTISDRLAGATRALGRIFSIAPAAEEAIIGGGHEASAVYWIDDSTAKWVSSTYYPEGLPWYIGKSSTLATRLDKGSITWSAALPDIYAESLPYVSTGAFDSDHIYTRAFSSVQDLKHSPVVNDYVIDLAEAVLEGAGLGTDASTDLLALHLVAGVPYNLSAELSPELLDSYYLLDKAVARLLGKLEATYGKDQVLVALCGTGMARRDPLEDDKGRYPSFAPERCRAITNMYLHAKYGIKGLVTEVTDRGELFLDRKLLEQDGSPSLDEVQNAVASFLLDMSGVSYTIADHSLRDYVPGDVVGRGRLTAMQSALPTDRPDVFIGISPGYTIDGAEQTAYVRYAPMPTMLLLWGAGMEPEQITAPLDLRYVSAEICHTLRIRPPTL